MTNDARIAAMHDHLYALAHALSQRVEMPPLPDDVIAALVELANAEQDVRENDMRHPPVRDATADSNPFARAEDPEAMRKDWSRCLSRQGASVQRLARIGEAYRADATAKASDETTAAP